MWAFMKQLKNKIRMKILSIAFLTGLLIFQSFMLQARNNHPSDTNVKSILVVGFAGNINSNFLSEQMVAERFEVCPQTIDSVLHEKLLQGFGNLSQNPNLKFIFPESIEEASRIRNVFTFNGDSENMYPELSETNEMEFRAVMDQYNADYIMVFGQYYLKWREEPFQTFFHILNYSLINRNLQEMNRGNEFFTTFVDFRARDVEKQLSKLIQRSAANVRRTIN